MSMSIKTIARAPRIDDVVITKTGRLFVVDELKYSPSGKRIALVGVYSLDDRLPNAFDRSEVAVVAQADANHAREAAKLAQLDRELALVKSEHERGELADDELVSETARLVTMSEQRERELDLIETTPTYIVEQAARAYELNKTHDKRCLAAALISAIENMRDAAESSYDFRLDVQSNTMLSEADEYLIGGLQTCSCNDAAARHAYIVSTCEAHADELSAR